MFYRQPRVAIAANRTCLRPLDYIQPRVQQESELVVIPNQQMGASQQHADGPGDHQVPALPTQVERSSTGSVEASKTSSRPQLYVRHPNGWMHFWQTQWAPPGEQGGKILLYQGCKSYWLLIDLPLRAWKPIKLEQYIKVAYPEIAHDRRFMMVTANRTLMASEELYDPSMGVLQAYPS